MNWLRLYAVSMPAVILLVWTANRAGRYRRHAFGILIGLIIISAIGQTASHQLQPVIRIELPGGVAASNPNLYPKLHWLAQHTKPGESFFQANWPGLYLPLRLRNPLFLDTLPTYEPTRAAYIERTLTELEQNPVRYILWNPRIDHSDRPRAWQDQLAIVSDYLRTRYRRVHVFRDLDEVWERR